MSIQIFTAAGFGIGDPNKDFAGIGVEGLPIKRQQLIGNGVKYKINAKNRTLLDIIFGRQISFVVAVLA